MDPVAVSPTGVGGAIDRLTASGEFKQSARDELTKALTPASLRAEDILTIFEAVDRATIKLISQIQGVLSPHTDGCVFLMHVACKALTAAADPNEAVKKCEKDFYCLVGKVTMRLASHGATAPAAHVASIAHSALQSSRQGEPDLARGGLPGAP